MEQLVDKLASLEREVSSQKGDFALFGVFVREDAQNRWDLLVSAQWLEANKKEALEYLADRLKLQLDAQEWLSLSRVVILEKGNPILAAVRRMVNVRHGRVKMENNVVSGLEIRRAYVITATKD